MKIKLDAGAYMPERAHPLDAGLDILARETKEVPAGGHAVFDTGVHMEIAPGFAGLLMSKSGLNVNYSITSEGVIDAGYTGSIKVKLYNHGDLPYQVRAGDKISQLLIVPVAYPEIELVEDLQTTERGDSGFGSTGR